MLVEHEQSVTEAQVLRFTTQCLYKTTRTHRVAATPASSSLLSFREGREEETTTSRSVAFQDFTTTFICRFRQISLFCDGFFKPRLHCATKL